MRYVMERRTREGEEEGGVVAGGGGGREGTKTDRRKGRVMNEERTRGERWEREGRDCILSSACAMRALSCVSSSFACEL